MSTEIRVPTLGESVTEATVGQWFKKAGEPVNADEPLVELETDKVTVEVPAPSSGTLAEIVVADGETVEVGALLATLTEGAGHTADGGSAQAIDAGSSDVRLKTPEETAAASPAPAPAASGGGTDMPPAPAAAKRLAEAGLSADQVDGSGRRGQVLKEDVLAAVARGTAAPAAPVQARAPSPAPDAAREERVRMTRLRQTIAQRLKDAQNTAAMLTTFNDVDMGAVMELRSQ